MKYVQARRFPVEIILLCVRSCCKYGITYRNLSETLQERGVDVDASTIFSLGTVLMLRSLRSACGGIRDIAPDPGGSMRPMFESVASGSTCSVQSTSMAS
jgi:transposase-like protein